MVEDIFGASSMDIDSQLDWPLVSMAQGRSSRFIRILNLERF